MPQSLTTAGGGSVWKPFSGTVATLTDIPSGENANDFTVSINWGDGNTSAGTLQTTSAGKFLVQGSHTYASTGTKSVTVTVWAELEEYS